MTAKPPLVLSELRAMCGGVFAACADCRSVERTTAPRDVKHLVPFLESRRGAAYAHEAPGVWGDGEVLRCPRCGCLYLLEHELEYTPIYNPYELPDPPEDRYAYTRLTAEELFRSDWYVTARVDLGGAFGKFAVLPQDFFTHHAFARTDAGTLVLPDEEPPIVADDAVMARVIAGDPPDLVDREADYACFVDVATSGRILQVEAFDGIPWRADLTDDDRAQIEELRGASPIEPMRVERAADAVVVRRWIIAQHQLICRVLTVRPTGEVTREDAVVGMGIPVAAW